MSRTSTEPVTLSGPAMGSRWTARLAAPEPGLAATLAAAVERIEAQASLWRPESDLCRLNAAPVGALVALQAELFDLLTLSLKLGRKTGGLFDIAMGGLSAAWGFGAAPGQVRPEAMRAAPRNPTATQDQLELDPARRAVRKHAPLTLALDGIAKGHAVDAMAEAARAAGISNALFGLDGEMRALSRRPDGHAWGIAVEAPEPGRRSASGLVALHDSAPASSGDYRHFVMVGSQRVSHTINPRSGLPANGVSVTVIADSCARTCRARRASRWRAHGIAAL